MTSISIEEVIGGYVLSEAGKDSHAFVQLSEVLAFAFDRFTDESNDPKNHNFADTPSQKKS